MGQFKENDAFPLEPFLKLSGPLGPALVRVYSDGKTQPGWGLQGSEGPDGELRPGFMENYLNKKFYWKLPRMLSRRNGEPFAFVMRSLAMVCIDIDGKNDGFQHATRLGNLPPTLAERSKSGDGVHLFYRTVSDLEWDDEVGFARFSDQIGIVPGVDIRSTGCVYHYAHQRWNQLPIAPLPEHLEVLFNRHSAVKRQRVQKIKQRTGDDEDMLLMQEELLIDLNRPIPEGKRNTSLFAIGQQLREAEYEDWEDAVYKRALEVGLPAEEANKLVDNISKYGSN